MADTASACVLNTFSFCLGFGMFSLLPSSALLACVVTTVALMVAFVLSSCLEGVIFALFTRPYDVGDTILLVSWILHPENRGNCTYSQIPCLVPSLRTDPTIPIRPNTSKSGMSKKLASGTLSYGAKEARPNRPYYQIPASLDTESRHSTTLCWPPCQCVLLCYRMPRTS